MTTADLIATVRNRMLDDSIPARDIEAESEAALHLLAEDKALGPHATDFQEDRTLTLASGKVAVPVDMLPGYISRITHASGEVEMVENRAEFTYQYGREFKLAAIEAGFIHTQDANAVAGSGLTGDIVVTGIIVPSLTNLKVKYEDEFIKLVMEGLKGNRVAPAARGPRHLSEVKGP